MITRHLMSVLPMLAMAGMSPFHKSSEAERMVNNASLEALVNEYNLIQAKKSKLSRRQRDLVEARVEYYLEKGLIMRKAN